ncbi:hypothetical protein [Muriicola marianensis]|nr:hypothetical protein [Muriicola marianensis]
MRPSRFIIPIAILALFSLLGFSENEGNKLEVKLSNLAKMEVVKCKYRQCNAVAKSTGKRCQKCVSKSSDTK